MLKKSDQQGHSKREPEAYVFQYVEGLSAARTQLADFFRILLFVIFFDELAMTSYSWRYGTVSRTRKTHCSHRR